MHRDQNLALEAHNSLANNSNASHSLSLVAWNELVEIDLSPKTHEKNAFSHTSHVETNGTIFLVFVNKYQ